MSHSSVAYALAALVLSAGAVSAQQTVPPEAQSMAAKKLPRQHLSGPRFGFTVFTGDVADKRDAAGLAPMMTQFGWQFETRIMSTEGGNQALMEWVVLVGGVEQVGSVPARRGTCGILFWRTVRACARPGRNVWGSYRGIPLPWTDSQRLPPGLGMRATSFRVRNDWPLSW